LLLEVNLEFVFITRDLILGPCLVKVKCIFSDCLFRVLKELSNLVADFLRGCHRQFVVSHVLFREFLRRLVSMHFKMFARLIQLFLRFFDVARNWLIFIVLIKAFEIGFLSNLFDQYFKDR
jgi:hypothetical protein